MAYAWAVYTHALMLANRWGEPQPVSRALLISSSLQLGALVAAAVVECTRAPSAGEAAVLKQALLSGGSGGVPAQSLSTDPRRKRQRPWCACGPDLQGRQLEFDNTRTAVRDRLPA